MSKSSEFSGFYKLSVSERVKLVKRFAGLSDEEAGLLEKPSVLGFDVANRMVENLVGVMPVPLGVAVNFLINGRELVVPMAIEEPSVIAAASNAAKMARMKGGFHATSTDPIMIGQIQIVGIQDAHRARFEILAHKEQMLKKANDQDPVLVSLGGGARDLDVRIIETFLGKMVIAELLVDCRDAMGANAVNTMAEAGAHAYAARSGHYTSLTTWEKNADGDLVGTLEMPMAVGIVGGATASNPIAKIAVKILGVKSARELAEIIVSVGLAQNLAALRALAAEGIQRGHMNLHARNIAISAGAAGGLIDKIAEQMVAERKIRVDRAKELLEKFSKR